MAKTAWDEAQKLTLVRGGEKLDPGVNFFVAMLNQLNLPTFFSCEGHPDDFYVTFQAPLPLAQAISDAGFLTVELLMDGDHLWAVRRTSLELSACREGESEKEREKGRVRVLRHAAEAWEAAFGELDWDRIVLEE